MGPAAVAHTLRSRARLGAALTGSIALLLLTPLVPATAATRSKAHAPAGSAAPAAAGAETTALKHDPTPVPASQPTPAEDPKRLHPRAAGPTPAPAPRVQERHPAAGRDGARPQSRRGQGAEGVPGAASKPAGGSATGEGAQTGAAAQSGEAGQDPQAAARSRRRGKGGKGVKEREARERAGHAKEELEHEAQSRLTKQRATAVPAASAPAAGSVVATTAAASAPAPASTGTAPPAAPAAPTVRRQQAVAASGSGRRAARGRRAVAGAPAARSTATGVAAALAPARAVTRPATARRGAGRSAAAKPSSPALIQTVTKIINVVPAAMRWIIAGLIALALALGVSSRVAAMRARRLARQRRELLEDVGLLQAALLPALPERLGEVAASAAYKPASGPAAGGDFYDVFALEDGSLGVIVGDVSGHGRAALPHTTLVRYTLRAYLEAGLSPRSALQTAAPVLERQLGEVFATVVLAAYDPQARTLVYASAGHPPPIVAGVGPAGESPPIALLTRGSSPPIGAGQPTGLRQTVVALPGDAIVCFFTDGVVEARVEGSLYGAERLAGTLAALGPEASAGDLLERVSGEADRRPDDMAACLLRVEGAVAPPRVHIEEIELDRTDAARRRLSRFLLAGVLPPEQVEQVARDVDGSLAEHGAVVLELRPGAGAPQMRLRRHNIAVLRPHARERSHDKEVSVG